MDNNNGSMICALTCWGVALFAGALAAVMLMLLGGWMFIQAAFIGALVFVVGGALVSWLLCRPLPPLNAVAAAPAMPKSAETPAASAPAPAPAPASASAKTVAAAPEAAAGPAVKPSPRLAGQEDLAARKGEWSYKGEADVAAEGAAPETLNAARGGAPDDLKLLKGVGPKLEQTLNELGFYHFDQVAAWTDEHVAWVDERLKFKGRIERDGWIEQAKILAAGGETEFSRRNK